jgi:hypothetical protein
LRWFSCSALGWSQEQPRRLRIEIAISGWIEPSDEIGLNHGFSHEIVTGMAIGIAGNRLSVLVRFNAREPTVAPCIRIPEPTRTAATTETAAVTMAIVVTTHMAAMETAATMETAVVTMAAMVVMAAAATIITKSRKASATD